MIDLNSLVEVTLKDSEVFLKIRETLTRIDRIDIIKWVCFIYCHSVSTINSVRKAIKLTS